MCTEDIATTDIGEHADLRSWLKAPATLATDTLYHTIDPGHYLSDHDPDSGATYRRHFVPHCPTRYNCQHTY